MNQKNNMQLRKFLACYHNGYSPVYIANANGQRISLAWDTNNIEPGSRPIPCQILPLTNITHCRLMSVYTSTSLGGAVHLTMQIDTLATEATILPAQQTKALKILQLIQERQTYGKKEDTGTRSR